MPQIIVMADTSNGGPDRAVMFTERVNERDFESRHFQTQLVERLGWAVGDASAVERSGGSVSDAQGERRDHSLVDAGAVALLGHANSRAAGDIDARVGSRSSALATSQNVPTTVGGLDVLARVADRDAVLGRVAAGLHVTGDGPRLGRAGRDEVIGVDRGQAGELLAGRAHRRRCRPGAASRSRRVCSAVVAASRSTAPRNRCETSRLAAHGVWYSSRPAKCSSSSAGAPDASICSKIVPRSGEARARRSATRAHRRARARSRARR